MKREHFLIYMPEYMRADFMAWPEAAAQRFMDEVLRQSHLEALRRREEVARLNNSPATALAQSLEARSIQERDFIEKWGYA